ncbi:MAG TPA: polysaccharide deacetylase family protein [Bryobacteraceae bacterium]|nr:polysaccharide deacetylase family protein [Bryobacteraceae bacterium]
MGFWLQWTKRLTGGFVLAFHEIPPERLARFVECLAPDQPVPLTEITRRLAQRRSTRGLFAITVDDGVGDNVRALSRLFLARQWPATFYLPVQYLETGEGMAFQWWRRLAPYLPPRKLALHGGVLDLSRRGALRKTAEQMELWWHSKPLGAYWPMIQELVEVVEREGISRSRLQPELPISWQEARELAQTDLIRFESHGVTHTAMSALTDDELVFELKHSRDVVSERCGRDCRHLAYPFGSPLAIGERAAALARRYYDSAATMSAGAADGCAAPWLLPRIPLYATNSLVAARVKTRLRYSRPGPHAS